MKSVSRKKKREEIRDLSGLNFLAYVLLLILTPFLLLQNYLQAAIGTASNARFEIFSFSIPWVVLIAVLLLAFILFITRRKIKNIHVYTSLILISLVILGQQLTDYYFGHKFYELQHNWHYLAYCGFAIVSWRFWKRRGKNSAQIILYTLLFALGASTLDEFAQVPLSNRVFDICDIAKDTYGAVLGNILVFYMLENGRNMPAKLKMNHRKIADYFKNPLTLLVYEYIFALFFISISSTLSDVQYALVSFLLPLAAFFIVWLFIHLLQFKLMRYIELSLLGIMFLALAFSFVKHRNDYIVKNSYGLTVYKGIPLPYLDVMFFDNGTFRFVDKKHVFNQRDQINIMKKCSDILLIGSGAEGLGGKGFPENMAVQFVYNPNIGRMTQIIILPTPQACEVFNDLKQEGKNVTFILHNTC